MNIFSKMWSWLSYKPPGMIEPEWYPKTPPPPPLSDFAKTRMKQAPHMDLDAHLGNAVDEEAGLKWLANQQSIYKECTGCKKLVNKSWLYDRCYKCCRDFDGWEDEALAAASCEVEWKDGPQIGDIVIANVKPVALEHSQWYKILSIDLNWKPHSWHLNPTDKQEDNIFVQNGDQLTIISRPMIVYDCLYLLFKVKDKYENEFYLSAQYLTGK